MRPIDIRLVSSLGISLISSWPWVRSQKRGRGVIPASARSHRTSTPYLVADLTTGMSLEDLGITRNRLLFEGPSDLRYSNSSVDLDAESSRMGISINELVIPFVRVVCRIRPVLRAIYGENQRLCRASENRPVPNHSKIDNRWTMYLPVIGRAGDSRFGNSTRHGFLPAAASDGFVVRVDVYRRNWLPCTHIRIAVDNPQGNIQNRRVCE